RSNNREAGQRSRREDDPATAFFCSFEVHARDQDIGNAEPNRTTRIHSTDQAVHPEIDLGTIGVRSWPKRCCGRLIQYRLPIALPNVSSLAELLPHQQASDPMPDPVVAVLKDIQSAQQQHVASLQENSFSLQQNTALLQLESTSLASLRQSITDEQVDVK